jgi:hypothetical protein
MFGTYRTVDNRLVCMVRKNADKVFNNNNQNRFRRRKANQTNYVFEVPEQDFLFVSSVRKVNSFLILNTNDGAIPLGRWFEFRYQ